MAIDEKTADNRWARYAPETRFLDHADKAEFFSGAPAGSVVEIYGDLYERSERGSWIHLEDLVSTGGYGDYREHNTSTAEYMVKDVASSEYSKVRVLRIGQGSW